MTEVIDIHKLIELRAYEKWQYRMEHNMLFRVDRGGIRKINEIDDWHEAREEILREEYKDEFR